MKTHTKLLVVALTPLLLASCVMSEKPLSDERTSRVDQKLIGAWRQVKSKGNPDAMTIGRKEIGSNVMQWVSLSLDKKQQVRVKRYDLFIKPGKTDYISIALKPDANVIGKYKTPDSSTFHLYLLDLQVIGKAVEEGKLKGKIERQVVAEAAEQGKAKGKIEKKSTGDYKSVMLSDEPARIIDFLEKNAATCYVKEPIVYRRQAAKP